MGRRGGLGRPWLATVKVHTYKKGFDSLPIRLPGSRRGRARQSPISQPTASDRLPRRRLALSTPSPPATAEQPLVAPTIIIHTCTGSSPPIYYFFLCCWPRVSSIISDGQSNPCSCPSISIPASSARICPEVLVLKYLFDRQ